MKKSFISYILLLLLTACGSEPEVQQTKEQATQSGDLITLNTQQIHNSGIKIGPAVYEKIGASIQVNGVVDVPPQNKVAITFPYGGFVKQVKVLDGMQIKKGQTLITFEDPALIQLQQDYLESSSQLEYLKADYERQKELNSDQVNSQKTLQLAKSNYQSMLAKVKGLKAKLALANISVSSLDRGEIVQEVAVPAPFNGVVTKSNAEVGKYAQPQDILLELIDLKHCHVEAYVFEKDLYRVKLGQQVHLTMGTSPDELMATVFLVGKEVGPDKTVKVHLHLNREDESLVPGTYVKARIDISNEKQQVVPEDAIVQYKGKYVVFEQVALDSKGATYRMIYIEQLGEEDGKVAIRAVNGKLGEHLVLQGAYSILSVITIGSDE